MPTMLTTFGAWTWFAAGVILLLLELMIPGAYMLWLGLAAVAVGAISLGVVWTWQMQCIAFVVLAAAAFPIWRRWGRSAKKPSDQPFLNQRADALVGRLFTLEKPIVDGVGTIRVDDTIWRVKGPDTPAGMRVRIERTDGPMLIVARAA
jgi:membrane protein implicated in regulation of membrane protease activity